MKKFVVLMMFAVVSMVAFAQDKPRQFDPQKFEQKLESFIVADAKLSQEDSVKIMPIFREMRKAIQEEMMKQGQPKRGEELTEEESAQLVKTHDACEVKIKQLQQTYHEKFLEVLPASKVMKVIRAEERFMQEAFGEVHARRGAGFRKGDGPMGDGPKGVGPKGEGPKGPAPKGDGHKGHAPKGENHSDGGDQ